MPNRPHRVSAIIPTFNRLEKLKNAIRSLQRQTSPVESLEIIVVDDGSTDGTLDWLTKAASELQNLRVLTQEHAGPAVARNLAARAAEGAVLLFIGDDILASEQLVETHLGVFEKMGTNVAVQGGVQLAASVQETRFARYLTDKSAAQFQLNHAKPGATLPFGAFYTCNCSVPKKLLEDCGGFPTDVVYYDDTYLGWKLQKRGASIIYEPRAEAFHDHTQTLDEFLTRQKQAGKDAAVLSMRHPELRKLLRVDQTAVLEGTVSDVVKKLIKRLLFNRLTVPTLKRVAQSRLLPFSLACLIFSGLIGYEHRTAAKMALVGSRKSKR